MNFFTKKKTVYTSYKALLGLKLGQVYSTQLKLRPVYNMGQGPCQA